MGHRDDSHFDILASADHAGEGPGLLPGSLAVVPECDCCGKQMEPDSSYQFDAKRLWLGAESGGHQGCLVSLALICLPPLS